MFNITFKKNNIYKKIFSYALNRIHVQIVMHNYIYVIHKHFNQENEYMLTTIVVVSGSLAFLALVDERKYESPEEWYEKEN